MTHEWDLAEGVFDVRSLDGTVWVCEVAETFGAVLRWWSVRGGAGTMDAMATTEILHEIGPLNGRPRFPRAISHFSTNVGCEDFKDPSIRVLVCHGPGWGCVCVSVVVVVVMMYLPVKVEYDKLFLGHGGGRKSR